MDAAFCAPLVPRRDPDGHKFSFGRVTTVCGSLDFAGAAYLAALGAARGGAGLVVMALPTPLRPVLAARLPEAVLVGMPVDDRGEIDSEAALRAIEQHKPDALVVGPGLEESASNARLVLDLIAGAGPPAVIDAGALNMLAQTPDWFRRTGRALVLTPHPGEFARLTGEQAGATDGERLARAGESARQFGHVLVLKGARTVVAAPDGRRAVAPFANPLLATAGSGDVLAGLIGALLGQGAAPFDAACLGVYLHGRAGERLSESFGDSGALASEIADQIPAARRELAAHST